MSTDREPMQRVDREHPCGICGKPDWCLVAPDGSAAICSRIEEGARSRAGDAGWLFILREDDRPAPRSRSVRLRPPPPDLAPLVAARVASTPARNLERWARELYVSVAALQQLRSFESKRWVHCLCFPMVDALGQVVGVRVRHRSGKKWSAPGSRAGAFVPADMPATGPLFLVEGPTTCTAALTLGLAAVGRSSARPADDLELPALQQLARGRDVVLVGENDQKADGKWPGRDGAEHAAERLLLFAASIRVTFPLSQFKDLRDALRVLGLESTRAVVERMLDAAVPLELRVAGAGVRP